MNEEKDKPDYTSKSFIMDMDGVIYYGNRLIPGAKEFIQKLKDNGNKFLFLTNNSSLTPKDLCKKLAILGIDVSPDRIFTSAIAAAEFLKSQKSDGSAYVIGDAGLYNALHEVGYQITEYKPDYVVFGETRTYSLEMIEKACRFIQEGARFIATHPDLTGPSDFGIVPSVGSLVTPIEKATGVKPYFVGKPNPLMMRAALRKLGAHSEETVMIGDRMDTDILAGIETGLETILVLTGVTKLEDIKDYPYIPHRICESIKDVWP
ncbi:MAG: TIGR01457 family HAD-type hydrolase [Spirochaetes bacterium]|nr:MAG: TIGR01457 family HAD-type hydrolase [Spirochaetota bacterium]